VIDIMEALKRSLAEKRKPARITTASAGAEAPAMEIPAKRPRKTRVS
jgi:non-homologous end joining protein Ku